MKNVELSRRVYNEMLNVLNNQHAVDSKAEAGDMRFLSDDDWLRDSAVIERIVSRQGMWEIQLVFAHNRLPNKLIKRIITRNTSLKRAQIFATYMRRLAAKDQRGTLEVNLQDFGLCTN